MSQNPWVQTYRHNTHACMHVCMYSGLLLIWTFWGRLWISLLLIIVKYQHAYGEVKGLKISLNGIDSTDQTWNEKVWYEHVSYFFEFYVLHVSLYYTSKVASPPNAWRQWFSHICTLICK